MNEIAPVNSTALMSFIERAAINPDFDVQKFGELLRMQREMEHDQARRAFNQAMAITQADMPPVVRSATNKHLGNKYAKLEDVDREMRPIYTAHGFSVRFGSAPAPEGYIRITCTVAHASGYFEENYLDAPTNNVGSQGGRTATTGVQAVGSAVTYLRRYLLGMVFNIVLADDDDDGESMRPAAAATPRAERKVSPQVYGPLRADEITVGVSEGDVEKYADIYEKHNIAIELLDEPNGNKWVGNLEMLLANATSQAVVVVIAGHQSVGTAVAKAPEHVKRRVNELLAKAYGRFAEPAAAEPGDELDEVVIAGEEKLAAG